MAIQISPISPILIHYPLAGIIPVLVGIVVYTARLISTEGNQAKDTFAEFVFHPLLGPDKGYYRQLLRHRVIFRLIAGRRHPSQIAQWPR